MFLSNDDFDKIINKLSAKESMREIMTGILLFDPRNGSTNSILNFLEDYDRLSSYYIDFFLPGYISESRMDREPHLWDRTYPIKFKGVKYYFQPDLFMAEVDRYERDCHFTYNYSPVLVLLDIERYAINNPRNVDERRFVVKRNLAIDLGQFDRNAPVQALFKKIFDYAKANTNMGPYRFNFKYRVLLGHHVAQLKQELKRDFPGILLGTILGHFI